jgi:hypothetical protein
MKYKFYIFCYWFREDRTRILNYSSNMIEVDTHTVVNVCQKLDEG